MSAGVCTFHRVLYLGSACPACVAQNRLSEVVIDLCEAEDERDALRKAAEERGITLEIEDDVEF
jgi:hypothetical protein